MTGYAVTFAASATKEMRDLTSTIVERILPRIRELADNPRPPGCKKLHGFKNRWRIRVGDWRIVYQIDDGRKAVDIARIAHRREVYEL